MDGALLWVPLTLVAAATQVLRNGLQSNLTTKIGTLGATQVRFIYGLPFAVLFLLAALLIEQTRLPEITRTALGWSLLGESRMILSGVAAGGLFGLSAIAFRGAAGALPQGDFIIRSLTVLVVAMTLQCLLLGLWLALRDRAAFTGSLREWRGSLGAGFTGAVSSAFWFAAFALTAAASVRTFGLIELPMVALFSGRLTGKVVALHELLGLGIVMLGVGLLLAAQAA